MDPPRSAGGLGFEAGDSRLRVKGLSFWVVFGSEPVTLNPRP